MYTGQTIFLQRVPAKDTHKVASLNHTASGHPSSSM
ncbi:mCG147325 [Mus musculus]|nr:mCG147325 [Mus musculus]